MAQYTYNEFIKQNIAPTNAKYIGIYNSSNERVGEIPVGDLINDLGTPLYKVGLLSDIHVDTTDYNYQQYLNSYPYSDEGAGDLERAFKWLRDNEQVDMVCACGDLSQGGGDNEFTMTQTALADFLSTIPFYTCTGNHDCSGSHSGASTFLNYTRRTIDSTAHTIVTSSAYNNSYYFLHPYTNSNGNTVNDVFVFFSMYNYSAGNAYLADDLTWLAGVLEQFKSNRVFVFTHLFFPDYAGNLGRVNGSGGIYPGGNWMSGSGLTSMTNLLSKYRNVYWFSGHSHWKWDLQRFQSNANVARYGNEGAWTIHIPSCALPIDSDYTNTSQQTSTNRVEKPLESQGGVMYVYEDRIVIRGIDFNINSSQNGSTEQCYKGDEYVRYLPIATYELHSGVEPKDGEDIVIGDWEMGTFSKTAETTSEWCIRSPYIPITEGYHYYLTTEPPIGDQSNENSIRELSIWCFSSNAANKCLGRIENVNGLNTVTSKIGETDEELKYFDRVYDHEELTDAILSLYPDTKYLRMRCYRMGTGENNVTIDPSLGAQIKITEVPGDVDVEPTPSPDPTPDPSSDGYVTYSNVALNTGKAGAVINNVASDYGSTYDDYVCVTFSGKKQGVLVDSPSYNSSLGTNQSCTLIVEDLKVFSGAYTSSGFDFTQTTISLPSYVGFYMPESYGSGAARYQIANNTHPSTTENNSNGKTQFQTSSSYTGGTITILMKIKLVYTQI